MNKNLIGIGFKVNSREEGRKLIAFFEDNGYNIDSFSKCGKEFDWYWGVRKDKANLEFPGGNYKESYNVTYESFDEYMSTQPLPPQFKIKITSPRMAELVQEEFFARGIPWQAGIGKVIKNIDYDYIIFGETGKTICQGTGPRYPIVTFEDFLARPLPEDKVWQKLNGEYSICVAGDTVEVKGLHEFSFPVEKLRDVIKATKEDFTPDFINKCIPVPGKQIKSLVIKRLLNFFSDGTTGIGDYIITGKTSFCVLEDIDESRDFMNLQDVFIEPSIIVRLNDTYAAKITKDGVKVGCQDFPLSVIQNLKF